MWIRRWPAILGGPTSMPVFEGPYVPGMGDFLVERTPEQSGVYVRLFYPTNLKKQENTKDRWTSWIADDEFILAISVLLFGCFAVVYRIFHRLMSGDYKIPAPMNSPLAETQRRLPVIVFSHGICTGRFFYSSVLCELAAHGYVVAAVEHSDGSAATTVTAEHGHIKRLPFRKVLKTESFAVLTRNQVDHRVNEVIAALDLLKKMDIGKAERNVLGGDFNAAMFAGRLDTSTAIVGGHSFGGSTTLRALSKTSDFKAGFLLDPWMFPIKSFKNMPHEISQPLLCINVQTSQIEPSVRDLKRFMTGSQPALRKSFCMKGCTHEYQSDAPLVLGTYLNLLRPKTEPYFAKDLNNALILSFLSEALGNKVSTNCVKLERLLEESGTLYLTEELTVNNQFHTPLRIPSQYMTFW